MMPVTPTMVSRPLITAVRRWQLKGAVQPDTQGNQGQGLCSSMNMNMNMSMGMGMRG
jgi:hypothetical protein